MNWLRSTKRSLPLALSWPQLNEELTAARGELASKQSELATALQYSATNESARAAAFDRLEAEKRLVAWQGFQFRQSTQGLVGCFDEDEVRDRFERRSSLDSHSKKNLRLMR